MKIHWAIFFLILALTLPGCKKTSSSSTEPESDPLKDWEDLEKIKVIRSFKIIKNKISYSDPECSVFEVEDQKLLHCSDGDGMVIIKLDNSKPKAADTSK